MENDDLDFSIFDDADDITLTDEELAELKGDAYGDREREGDLDE